MKVSFIMERGNPPRLNPIIADTFTFLENRGITVSTIYPEEELIRLDTMKVDADLYLLKSDTELSLSLAAALEKMGARVLNNCTACLNLKNKVLATTTLLRAKLPVPWTVAADHPSQLTGVMNGRQLIFKPYRGYHGVGINTAEEPSNLPWDDTYPDMVFAQDYLSSARKNLKIFAIGDEIFGVRKSFDKQSYLKAGEPTPLSSEISELARSCGKAFGLDLYGIDLAEAGDKTFILDINYFPGYRGVPDAPALLAEYIINYMRR